MTDADIIGFIRLEARLIDEQRFDEWLDLFAADGRYWMPLDPAQTDWKLQQSLYNDDIFLLRLRCERLKSAKTYSQKPKSRCHHLLQTPEITRDEAGISTWTAFHYLETRLDEQTLYAGWSRHSLLEIDGALRIGLKRIDLVNPDSAFAGIQLFM